MKVAVLYSDVKREYFSSEANYLTEKDALHDAEVVAGYVRKIGFKPVLIPANAELVGKLSQEKPDIVLNLGGSVRGIDSLSSVIPGLLEMLNLPFTGAKHAGETLSFNKYLVLKLLEKSQVPVPRYQLILDLTSR
jgi:D-alanine-D-alanine ligase